MMDPWDERYIYHTILGRKKSTIHVGKYTVRPMGPMGFVCGKDTIYIYIPGTQMTLVLNGKGLLLNVSNPKIEDKQVPGIYIAEILSIFLPHYAQQNKTG